MENEKSVLVSNDKKILAMCFATWLTATPEERAREVRKNTAYMAQHWNEPVPQLTIKVIEDLDK